MTILQICDPDPTRAITLTADPDVREVMREGPGERGGRLELTLVEHTHPANAVIEECERGYDLVVVGIGAPWGLEHRSFGLHAERLIHDCPASLLIIRQHSANDAAGIGDARTSAAAKGDASAVERS